MERTWVILPFLYQRVEYKINYLKISLKERKMGAALKLIVGLIIFLVGIYWYLPSSVVSTFFNGRSAFQAFLVVFQGLFGLGLILFGLIIAWIEFEDIKWERKEKKKIKK